MKVLVFTVYFMYTRAGNDEKNFIKGVCVQLARKLPTVCSLKVVSVFRKSLYFFRIHYIHFNHPFL